MKNAAMDIDYSDLHWGKYDEPITSFIDHHLSEFSFGDEDESDGQGNGAMRIGRRVYSWDDQGFQETRTFATVADAESWFADYRESYYSACEKCGEKVHSDEDSWYEHEKYECGSEPTEEQSSTHYAHGIGMGFALQIVWTYPLKGTVVAVAVGDDTRHTFAAEDLTPIPEDAYCSECGQIGCTADGR